MPLPAKLDLNDLITHRRAWRAALADCVKRCEDTGDHDNASYWRHELAVFDRTFAIFSTEPPDADLPDFVRGLPDREKTAYNLLVGSGFKLRDDKAWLAPDDEPLTTELMVAIAELQGHGFGPVVHA